VCVVVSFALVLWNELDNKIKEKFILSQFEKFQYIIKWPSYTEPLRRQLMRTGSFVGANPSPYEPGSKRDRGGKQCLRILSQITSARIKDLSSVPISYTILVILNQSSGVDRWCS
jgi:hypothetical protein